MSPEPSTSGSPVDSTGTSTGSECPEGSLGCPCGPECDEGLVCLDEQCQSPSCGDGYPDEGEQCDDGNDVPSDGCEPDCTISVGAAAVALGEQHACALFHTGGVKCWGRSTNGRLGYPGVDESIGDDETPADMDFVELGGPAVELALGRQFSCALLADGGVRCWGRNDNGQLGQGTMIEVGQAGPPSALGLIVLGAPAVQIAVGRDHVCALLDDQTLRCWGRNDNGQLGYPGGQNVGDNEVPASMPAVDVGGPVARVVAGNHHTCALLTSGQLRCWGDNASGQLGLDHTQDVGDNEDLLEEPTVDLGEPVVSVDTYGRHVCAILASGALRCWGRGTEGQLGLGELNNVGDNELPLDVPSVVLPGEAIGVAAGWDHTCVILSGGSTLCWGDGSWGQTGYGDGNVYDEPPLQPVQTAPATVVAGIGAGDQFTCVRSAVSEIKCWGRNNYGQLGYGQGWSGSLGDDELPDVVGVVPLE